MFEVYEVKTCIVNKNAADKSWTSSANPDCGFSADSLAKHCMTIVGNGIEARTKERGDVTILAFAHDVTPAEICNKD